jgi:hypothetical protein
MKLCKVCGWRRATRKGRCAADAQFHRRHGRDRTTNEVMLAYERQLNRLERVLSA